MTTEDKLKEYILNRYKSLREFAIEIDISTSTLASILNRGVDNANVSNIIKICKKLGLSVDELANGNITPINVTYSTERMTEITDILSEIKTQLIARDDLTIEGDPASRESIDTLVQAMTVGEKMAKDKNEN